MAVLGDKGKWELYSYADMQGWLPNILLLTYLLVVVFYNNKYRSIYN